MSLRILICFSLLLTSGLAEKVKKTKKKVGFISGRILPRKDFDLNESQLFYTPVEAEKFCETNRECAGFTFRGSKEANQKFRVHFFRYVTAEDFDVAKKSGQWLWTSYRVKRNFVEIFHRQCPNGDGTKTELKFSTSALKLIKSDEKSEKNLKWPSSRAAISFSFFDQNSILMNIPQVTYHDEVNLSDIVVNDSMTRCVTIFNLNEGAKISSSSFYIDKCCEGSIGSDDGEVSNAVDFLDCSHLSSKHFYGRYLSPATPVVIENCTESCPAKTYKFSDMLREFPTESGTIWTIEDSRSGKIKRVKSDEIENFLENSRAVHGQLTTPDSIKKIFRLYFESRNSTGPVVRDLLKELELVSESQLTIHFQKMRSVTPIQPGQRGLDSFVTLLSGEQHYILIPTSEKKDLQQISCSKECKNGSWIAKILPQIRKGFTVYGEPVREAILRPGQTLFIPHGWSVVISTLKDSLTLSESKLTDGGIELAAAELPESQIHIMKKRLQERDLFRPIWRRFIEILKQRRSPGKYS